MVCECILFNAFRFEINQCDSDMKTEKHSVNAISTDKLMLNIRLKMF